MIKKKDVLICLKFLLQELMGRPLRLKMSQKNVDESGDKNVDESGDKLNGADSTEGHLEES